MDSLPLKDKLVTAMLPHVAFDGWSAAALAAAADDCGMDRALAERLLPTGAAAVVHFVHMADRAMAADVEAAGLEGRGIGERVFLAVKLRLERWGEHREAVRRAASLLALPTNLTTAARLTWETSGAVWAAAGDRSHDFSWYTRRATLAAVYSATLLYWLDDESEGAGDTWSFLRRRLNDVRSLPDLRKRMETVLKGRKAALGGLAQRFGFPSPGC